MITHSISDFTMIRRSHSSSSYEQPPAADNNYSHAPENLGPLVVSGGEITHYAHSKHPLAEVIVPDLFTCGGCKEYGAGSRFSCQQCDFQLHLFCARAPPLLKNHPLHAQHQLVFHSKPKPANGGISWPRCDICGKSSKGFTYRCRACSFQMHPCCAMLSADIHFPLHPHSLKLLPPTNGSSGAAATDTGVACGECKKRRSGRMYRCTTCEYHVHAVCAKAVVNGLYVNGIPTPEKASVLGSAARLASQVVIEFIGGLIEGIGEGVGEAIIQNITRGRCRSHTRVYE